MLNERHQQMIDRRDEVVLAIIAVFVPLAALFAIFGL
jgi:hypothetical protein